MIIPVKVIFFFYLLDMEIVADIILKIHNTYLKNLILNSM